MPQDRVSWVMLVTMVRSSVQVVAHRGASEVAAEHTLVAYRTAIEHGADALEADVRLTRDGVLVCVHDRRVNRVSDGRGSVSSLELADLIDLDFSSWKTEPDRRVSTGSVFRPDRRRAGDRRRSPRTAGDRVEVVDRDGAGVLTLDRLVELARDSGKDGRAVQLHIETKHPTRYGGFVELALVDLLEVHGLAHPQSRADSPVTVMSYWAASLRRIHRLAPVLPTVYLMNSVPSRYRDGSLPTGVTIAGPSLAVLRASPSYVARLHDRGHRVHVFTVNDLADIDFVLGLGVDAIISNAPDRVLRRLGRTQ